MSLDHDDLREMKKHGDVEGLLNILETGDVKECREAACILGELRYRKALRPLLGSLETDDVQLRANAAWALGEIGDVKAVLPLIGSLNDPSENVRIHAAWALGRIGDKRAISGLKAALKNGSPDLRKHASEAIAKIESNGTGKRLNDTDYEENEINFSSSIDVPLVTLNVPSDVFECDYISRAEGASLKENGSTVQFSRDVMIKDRILRENTRRIVLGLKNEFSGLVSVDVLLRYTDNNGERQTSSVWLRMASTRKNELLQRSNTMLEPVSDMEGDSAEEIEEVKVRTHDSAGRKIKVTKPHVEAVRETVKPEKVSQKIPEPPKPEVTRLIKPEVEQVKDTIKPGRAESPEQTINPPAASRTKVQNIDSAVKLLSNIGMSGMTNAASTVTQLSGQEAESIHSQLRTIPVDQMKDEIISLGGPIVLIEVNLQGKGAAVEVKGEMQMYISKENALDIANELLCNPPDAKCKEFTEDITSTLKETANIFVGQYISAISEYIEVPLLLKAPTFRVGDSLQIAESVMKGFAGKVEFALATDLALGKNKTGRLILLFDPKSFDIIIQKLF